jgi:hypothetical protein
MTYPFAGAAYRTRPRIFIEKSFVKNADALGKTDREEDGEIIDNVRPRW